MDMHLKMLNRIEKISMLILKNTFKDDRMIGRADRVHVGERGRMCFLDHCISVGFPTQSREI